MTSRPIIFSAPMVRALLAGTKTQTRRALRVQAGADAEMGAIRCPYGQPGDLLWVRETGFAWGRWETRYSAKKGRDEWHFIDMTLECGRKYLFAADNPNYKSNLRANQGRGLYPAWWKRPAIHMPRAASRITLEITGVRVERLNDISEADAIAEGVFRKVGNTVIGDAVETATGGELIYALPTQAREEYRRLWDSINGHGARNANPWVWALQFRLQQTEVAS